MAQLAELRRWGMGSGHGAKIAPGTEVWAIDDGCFQMTNQSTCASWWHRSRWR